ncbi:MAG TPA: hypothetical protein VKR31_00905 [Rhizomicrobium sp.]|nr:hypothetical protein [Rhizomicrobium sp.]
MKLRNPLLAGALLAVWVGAAALTATESTSLFAFTPYTLARAPKCTVRSTTTGASCPDATTALNNAANTAVSLGVTLTIDGMYAVAQSPGFAIPSGLTVEFRPGACIVQQFTPGNTNGVIGNANYTVQVSNVTAYNMRVCGDPSHSLGGSAYRLNVANSVFFYPTVDHTGAPTGGRAYTIVAQNSQFIFPTFYDPYPKTGNGAFRFEGCTDSQVIGGYGVSGDGTWQFSPPINGTVPNQSIVRCYFDNVGGESLDGEFFSAQLHIEGASENQLGSLWPTNTAGVSTGYTANTVHDCDHSISGTVTPCQIEVLQVSGGAITQAAVVTPGAYTFGGSLPSTMHLDGDSSATFNVQWVNAWQGTNCIIDSGISGAPGQAISGRGLAIGNEGSNGAQCLGRPAIDGLTIANLTIDDSQDQQSSQVISISASDYAHPIGKVTFNSISVPDPFSACVDISGPVAGAIFNDLSCGRSHQGLVGYLSATAAPNATSATLAAGPCNLIKSGDIVGILLDNDYQANGANANKVQNVTPSSNCSAGSISLGTGLLGRASAGLAAVYDYSEQVYNLTAAASGSPATITLQAVGQVNATDQYILVCNDGTSVSGSVASVNKTTNQVTLANACTSGANAGNQFADRTVNSAHAVVTTEGVRGATFNDFIGYGADASIFSLGGLNGSPVPSSDVIINNPTLRDVANASTGINYSNCAHCPWTGGTIYATAGSAGTNAASYSTTIPTGTDNLAVAMTAMAGNSTIQTENPGLFAYAKPFYAKIDSEIVYVQRGMGTPNWTVNRALLGTSLSSHSVGAAITIAQSGVTDSPMALVDVGDLGYTDPANAIGHYQPGQGNDPQSLLGVNWQRTGINQGSSSGTVAFTDEFPQINWTGTGAITGVTFSTSMPPFKTNCQRWYNKNNTGTVAISNGTGIHNTGASSFNLTQGGYAGYCLDPTLQALYQEFGSAN